MCGVLLKTPKSNAKNKTIAAIKRIQTVIIKKIRPQK
jgi:hypothetical protein